MIAVMSTVIAIILLAHIFSHMACDPRVELKINKGGSAWSVTSSARSLSGVSESVTTSGDFHQVVFPISAHFPGTGFPAPGLIKRQGSGIR